MQVIARSSQAACHSFFTVRRVGIVAARRSTALRFTRRLRMTSRSSGSPALRSSSMAGGGRTAGERSRSWRAFMMAGECEPPLQKSTRDRHSRAEAAGIYRGELLRLQALLLALRQPREQRRDFLAEGLIARRTARLVPDDAAERERRFGRRGPVDERLHRAEIVGGTVWLGGFWQRSDVFWGSRDVYDVMSRP